MRKRIVLSERGKEQINESGLRKTLLENWEGQGRESDAGRVLNPEFPLESHDGPELALQLAAIHGVRSGCSRERKAPSYQSAVSERIEGKQACSDQEVPDSTRLPGMGLF